MTPTLSHKQLSPSLISRSIVENCPNPRPSPNPHPHSNPISSGHSQALAQLNIMPRAMKTIWGQPQDVAYVPNSGSVRQCQDGAQRRLQSFWEVLQGASSYCAICVRGCWHLMTLALLGDCPDRCCAAGVFQPSEPGHHGMRGGASDDIGALMLSDARDTRCMAFLMRFCPIH